MSDRFTFVAFPGVFGPGESGGDVGTSVVAPATDFPCGVDWVDMNYNTQSKQFEELKLNFSNVSNSHCKE